MLRLLARPKGLLDQRSPPRCELVECVLPGGFFGNHLPCRDRAVQAWCAQHAPCCPIARAQGEPTPWSTSKPLGPWTPIGVEVPSRPRAESLWFGIEVQRRRARTADANAILGKHLPSHRAQIRSSLSSHELRTHLACHGPDLGDRPRQVQLKTKIPFSVPVSGERPSKSGLDPVTRPLWPWAMRKRPPQSLSTALSRTPTKSRSLRRRR